jgi:hypothetical protein
MKVTIKGKDKLIASFAKAPDTVVKELRKTTKQVLNDTIKYVISSSDKGYVSRSGHLDKAMYSTVNDTGLGGCITLSKTVSDAPYALAQHEGVTINQTVTKRQSAFLTNKFKKYIAPETQLVIKLKPLKFLTRVWNSSANKARVFAEINSGVALGIKKAGL